MSLDPNFYISSPERGWRAFNGELRKVTFRPSIGSALPCRDARSRTAPALIFGGL